MVENIEMKEYLSIPFTQKDYLHSLSVFYFYFSFLQVESLFFLAACTLLTEVVCAFCVLRDYAGDLIYY